MTAQQLQFRPLIRRGDTVRLQASLASGLLAGNRAVHHGQFAIGGCRQHCPGECTDTSDPGHFGTGAEVSYGRFGTRQSEYLHGRPVTLHIM